MVRLGRVSVVGMGWVSSIYNYDESLDDVIEQVRAGSQEFADWLKFSQWRLP